MQIVIRKYSGGGSKELFDLLATHSEEIKSLLRSVTGFVSYTNARSNNGGFSVTVCQDKAGIDESVQMAKDWIAKNAADIGAPPPEVSVCDVIIHLDQ